MVEYRNKHNVRSEEDLETLASGEGSHYDKSDYAFVSKRDPIADYICKTYVQMQSDVYMPIKGAFFLATPVAVGLFSLFVSNSSSNVIAFTAFMNSITYIIFSMWLLGWILEKEIGPRSM
jgi:hypothetical protein